MQRTDSENITPWRPGAELEILKLRAEIMARVRAFFSERDVLEVDTPVLAAGASTDPAIESFACSYRAPGDTLGRPLYLQTSPEFFMKRLLCAGMGSIYQLAHVFRNGESGRDHNPEFMLLEWYRPAFSAAQLIAEIDDLLSYVLRGYTDYRASESITYQQWFQQETGLDPWVDEPAAFRKFAREQRIAFPASMPEDELDPWLDLLLTHWLEPRIEQQALFVLDYPPSQASLARIQTQPIAVAERFELYVAGKELANGFHELGDSREQRRRFERDNATRQRNGCPAMPVDEAFLAALEHGLPDCCGVALGIDRLVMIAAGCASLDAVMPFALERL